MTPPQYRDESVLGASDYYSNVVKQQESDREITLYSFLKRTIDILGSIFGLIVLSPLLVIIAIVVKWEDPKGSVIFHQSRVGKNEKPFRIYKFRSMCTDAEDKLKDLLDKNDISGAQFKIKDDPRITKVGKFIRRTSIDELPQLFNVLRGDMSLVGPRPSSLMEVNEYSNDDKKRLSVTPGCTGLWQVSGRNNLSFKEMVELDLAYIDKKCIWFDIKIILRTVKTVISPEGAY
jgi:exopolysaccharide biosynthesis polyprenyl glycosylphosphotransferase